MTDRAKLLQASRFAASQGRGGAIVQKRIKKSQKESGKVVTKPGLQRLMKRAGVKRCSGLIYEEIRECLKHFVTRVVSKAASISALRGAGSGSELLANTPHVVEMGQGQQCLTAPTAKTVTAQDVVLGLRSMGRVLYGYGAYS
jgi:histone H4